MQTAIHQRRFTSVEYYRMGEVGIFGPEERLELIDGYIVEMSPIGNRHMLCLDQATELFVLAFAGKARVTVQGPLKLNLRNVPQPDLVLFKFKPGYRYSTRPNSQNCYLVMEVSDSTLRYDTKIKVPLYAKTGVPEVWVEDLKHQRLLVYRDPEGETYQTQLTLSADDSIAPLAFPDTPFRVRDLLLIGIPNLD